MLKVEMKTRIKEKGKAHLVKELVNAGYTVDEAIDYVYDTMTLTKKQFAEKYFS